MTRGEFYASKNGGGLRMARKPFRCDHSDRNALPCVVVIERGAQYFDTCERKPNSFATKRLCLVHAGEELK